MIIKKKKTNFSFIALMMRKKSANCIIEMKENLLKLQRKKKEWQWFERKEMKEINDGQLEMKRTRTEHNEGQ